MPNTHHHEVDVWAVEGVFQHLVYSPDGAVEGLLIDTDGVPTQFVADPRDPGVAGQLCGLRAGQRLVVEGTESAPSPKGEPAHTVYVLERLASIDGRPAESTPARAAVSGQVVRFNYARHGEPNGVVLDSGDFVHTKPHGFEKLGLKIGDPVKAEGPARALATGHGRAIDAHSVNGTSLAPGH